MRYVFALIILLTLGCNKTGGSYKLTTLGEPADFSPLVAQFNSDLAKLGYPPISENISYYKFSSTSKTGYVLHGYCSRNANGEMAISLDADPNDLTVTDYVFFVHEIGHCAYGKHHDDSSTNIMNSVKSADIRSMFLDEATRLQLIKDMIEN